MSVDPNFLMQRLMRGGMSRMQAAAVVGNLKRESNFDPNAYNSEEGAYGLMQWRGPRFQALQGFANSQGKPWNDPGVQADFIGHELRTTERGNAQNFFAAQDVDSATKAFGNQVVRFGDKSLPDRQAAARSIYGTDTGQPLDPGAVTAQATGAPPGVSRETRYNPGGTTGLSGLLNSRPRGVRGGIEAIGEGLAMAFPRSASSGAPVGPPGGGAAAPGATSLSGAQPPPDFPGGRPPLPAARPETAPGSLTPVPGAVTSLPGAKMGALGDLASYEDGDWYA
jgi:hypothetical protein